MKLSHLSDWLIPLEVFATGLIILGVALNAYNVYPLNIIVGLATCITWGVISLAWRKVSLLTVQVICGIMYIVGWLHVWRM